MGGRTAENKMQKCTKVRFGSDLSKMHLSLQKNKEVWLSGFNHNARTPQMLQFTLRARSRGHSVRERHRGAHRQKLVSHGTFRGFKIIKLDKGSAHESAERTE